MPFPFEVPFHQVQADLDSYVDEIFSCLQSEFLTLPKGPGFVEYPVFERGYEALKRATGNFRNLSPEMVNVAVHQVPIALIVLRSMLGFTPPEWAYVTSQRTDVQVSQGAIRAIDRKVRMAPDTPMRTDAGITDERIRALVTTACQILTEGAPEEREDILHRLNKADTKTGLQSLQPLADLGVPYAMLLYERFLGRPFAGHRDSVSELVGDVLETAIEKNLHIHGISYRKSKRAERVSGFDQAPDFIIPDEFNPHVVIEAKVTEDDGTARDKVTRVQHLGSLAMAGQAMDQPRFEVVACIAGRGFGVRREDMKKLLLATRGKVFTLANLHQLVDCTKLSEFKTRTQIAVESSEMPAPISFVPRLVKPRREDRYTTCVPFIPLKVAAGAFGDPQHIHDDDWEWAAVDTKHRLRPGMFVAQVVGKSMEPAIPDGAFCLFAAPVEGTRQGRIVLVQLRSSKDPETAERFTVKRYESEKVRIGKSWRHATITLKPTNPEFAPIVLTGEEGEFQVIAELLEVLGDGH
jgi:SOS-response transcriptional repressor LexA